MALPISWLTVFLVHTLFAVTVKAASSCTASAATPIALNIANYSIASQDTSTYGIRFDVGDPKQSLCLTPSTVVDNTLLISKNICTGELQNMTQAQCRSYHGGTFDLVAAGASFQNVSLAAANLPTDPGWLKFNDPYTVAGATDLNIVSNIAVPNMTVVAITEGINFTAGHVGLGKRSTLLSHLKNSGMIPSLGFGLNAGSQSIQNPRPGNLVLGGYDLASVTSSFYNYPMNYSDTLAGRHCPLQVHIQGLQLLLEGRDPIQLIGEGDGHAACLEPYDNLFRLSETGLARFQEVTGWSAETNYDSKELYVPEPGLIYPSATGFNGSLKYFLHNGFTVEIPNSELQHPLRGLDKSGEYALEPKITEANIYREPLGAWVLGKVFLSRVYLAVDYEAQQIQLAEVNQNDVTPSPARFASASSGCPQSRGLAGATIAAIVLAVVIGLALIGGIGYFLYRRRRNRTQPSKSKEPASPPKHEHRLSIDEGLPDNVIPLERQEMSADRRISELESPNGGYAPPSPRSPASRQTSESLHSHSPRRASKSPGVPPPKGVTCNQPHDH